MSILSFLKEYAAKNPSRWHTPGHKGSLSPLDITELCDESFPGDLVREAEEEAAKFYKAWDCHFLTNGSSQGIKAAIMAAGGDIIAPKSCHYSVRLGANLAKVNLYGFDISRIRGDRNKMPGVPAPEDVERAIKDHPKAKAVLLESPDYYGRVIDPAIPKLIEDAGMYFFCDAAHGAHFPAHEGLFPQSYSGIADACNLSAHKTMDAYTQSAYLCVNNAALAFGINGALTLLGTTSPSYLLLGSLESAIEAAQNNKTEYERLYRDIEAFKQRIHCLQNDDFTRIVVLANKYGMTGRELSNRLAMNHIHAEKCVMDWVVFIATPHETKEDFERLAEAIERIAKK